MIRFRNPGSDLDTMIAVLKQLYHELHEKDFFDNTDIAKVLSKANLIASSGFTGDKAVALGANTNKSRDKTYNNAKMYAEIFRILGFLSIVNDAASNYRFTFIGEHMAAAGVDAKLLIEQCVLGMNNPNRIMDVSYKESVRFFSCVLLTMLELDDMLYRDEMILGPMSVNDNSEEDFTNMIDFIKSLRKTKSERKLSTELEKLAKSQTDNKKEGMTVNSVQNCTRFPISVLKYCGWVENIRCNIYGKSMVFMKLTPYGKETANKLKTYKDIRLEDYEKLSKSHREALIRLGTYSMLGRAGFETNVVQAEMDKDAKEIESITEGKEVLFSPYQTLDFITVNDALNLQLTPYTASQKNQQSAVLKTYAKRIIKKNVVELDYNTAINQNLMTEDTDNFIRNVMQLIQREKSTEQIVKILVEEHRGDNKGEFYPLVETLFRIIGVDCRKSRDGVNGERWDAMIRDAHKSIPIEIKSPGEEENVSIKAIRQALENKIVLLSRKTYITDCQTSSFVVGYKAPNDRAEVAELIQNIKETYGYKIAVFDIASLFLMAVNIIVNKKGINIEKLYGLEGIVNVKDIDC